MVRKMMFRSVLLGLSAVMAAAFSGEIFAAGSPKPIATSPGNTRDARLTADGVLSLQLLNSEGQGIAEVPVFLSFGDQKIAMGKTNAEGVVEFSELRPGVHTISAGAGRETLRLWSADDAPPQALNRVAIVADEQVVRGQIGIFTPDPNAPPSSNGYTFGGQLIDPLTVGAVAIATFATVKVIQLEDEVDALKLASP